MSKVTPKLIKELRELTGYAQRAKQVAQLRRQGIAFWLNAAGRPIVSRATFEGSKAEVPPPKTWEPSWGVTQR